MLRKWYQALRAAADLRLVPQYIRNLTEKVEKFDDLNLMLGNAEIDRMLDRIKSTDSKRLENFGFKGYSQNDEDGILQEIFNRIGVKNRQFVEFGTGNGLENNTVYLLCQGWSGLWIDGSKANHQSHIQNFGWAMEAGNLNSVCSFLTKENINEVISGAGIGSDIDVLSIDVDGNDYHLWNAINVVQPRVVVIEYNAYIPPPVRWIMEYNPDYVWDGRSRYFGASLESLERLGSEKGYSLVGCNISGLNAFFIRSDLKTEKFCENTSALALFQPRRWWLDKSFASRGMPYDRPFIE